MLEHLDSNRFLLSAWFFIIRSAVLQRNLILDHTSSALPLVYTLTFSQRPHKWGGHVYVRPLRVWRRSVCLWTRILILTSLLLFCRTVCVFAYLSVVTFDLSRVIWGCADLMLLVCSRWRLAGGTQAPRRARWTGRVRGGACVRRRGDGRGLGLEHKRAPLLHPNPFFCSPSPSTIIPRFPQLLLFLV